MKKTINVSLPTYQFDFQNRSDGLSGFMRIRNEGEYLKQSIESWLPELDELIIVYNNCQDNTAEIVEECANLYPDKIKAFHYEPIVYPIGSDEYTKLPEDDYHSIVNYYNFTLAQTTKDYVVKIDGDLIIPKERQGVVRDAYKKLITLKEKEGVDYAQPLSGFNLIDHLGELYVPSHATYCNLNGDLCMWRVDESTYFKKAKRYEVLDLSQRKILERIFVTYHMKYMKNDFGVGHYNFKENPKSHYYVSLYLFFKFLSLIPLKDICVKNKMPAICLDDLGIIKERDYRKEALAYLKAQGGIITVSHLLTEGWYYIRYNILSKTKPYLWLQGLKRKMKKI